MSSQFCSSGQAWRPKDRAGGATGGKRISAAAGMTNQMVRRNPSHNSHVRRNLAQMINRDVSSRINNARLNSNNVQRNNARLNSNSVTVKITSDALTNNADPMNSDRHKIGRFKTARDKINSDRAMIKDAAMSSSVALTN